MTDYHAPELAQSLLLQPNEPGRWKFTGTVTTRRGAVDEMDLILEDWTLRVVAQGDQLVITDPDGDVTLGGEWCGSWRRLGD